MAEQSHAAGRPDRLPRWSALVGAAIGMALLLAPSAPATQLPTLSSPELDSLRGKAREILSQIEEIDVNLELTIGRYNAANVRLEELDRQITETRRRLSFSRRVYRKAQSRLEERIVSLYVTGHQDVLEVILGATKLDQIIDQIDAQERIADADARLIEQVRATTARYRKDTRRLEQARKEQRALVRSRARTKTVIEQKLAAREHLYTTISNEIASLEAAERERQQALAEEARRRYEHQRELAEQAGIEIPTGLAIPEGIGLTPQSRIGDAIVTRALTYLGVPYVWAGADPITGFDCSGIVVWVYKQLGINLPHYTVSLWNLGVPVNQDELRAGDLVFFHDLGHMGIYVGQNQFLHAPHTGDVVKISSLDEPWYATMYNGARRIA